MSGLAACASPRGPVDRTRMIRDDSRSISSNFAVVRSIRSASCQLCRARRHSIRAQVVGGSRSHTRNSLIIFAESTAMIRRLHWRRNGKRPRSSKRRADLLQRLHVSEQLEVRAAPGSMIVDALALGGYPVAMAQLASEPAQEPQHPTQTANWPLPKVPPMWRSRRERGMPTGHRVGCRHGAWRAFRTPGSVRLPRGNLARFSCRHARDKAGKANRQTVGPRISGCIVLGREHSGGHRPG